MKRKIIYLDHTPFVGGAQLVLGAHMKALDKDKFDPVVVCSKQAPSLVDYYQSGGARVITIDFGRLKTFNPRVLLGLVKIFKELSDIFRVEKPDLVVTNTVRAHLVGSVTAQRLQIPVIWIIRDYTFPNFLLNKLVDIPRKILTVSKELVEYYHLEKTGKVQVIYVGTDFDQSSKDKLKLAEIENAIVVGFVGRLVHWKGCQVLVRAMEKVVKQNPRVKALVIGSGQGQDGDNETIVKKLARDLSLERNIIFVGFQPQEKIKGFYSLFDIFVHPSLEPEPFATVVVQAMMCKLPVIGTNIGGTPEIIDNGKNGILVNPDNPEELSEAILKIATDAQLRKRLGSIAYQSVYPDLTERSVTKKMERIFEEVTK